MTDTGLGTATGEAITRAQAHTAFRQAVRDGLERTGLRQKDLAVAVGKSAVDVSRYLSNPTRLPKDWALVRQILVTAGADIAAFEAGAGAWWGLSAPTAHAAPADRVSADGAAPSVTAEPLIAVDALTAETGHLLDRPIPEADRPDGPTGGHAAPSSPRRLIPAQLGPAHQDRPSGASASDAAPPAGSVRHDRSATDPGWPTFQMTPVPDRAEPDSPAPARRRRRPRWLLGLVALGNAVILVGAAVVAGVVLSAPRTETVAPAGAPPQTATTGPWPSTIPSDVPAPGVALRSAPSKGADTEIGRLPAGAVVAIDCGVTGELTTTRSGRQSTTWLHTPGGGYLSAHYVEFTGPDPIPDCDPAAPALPVGPAATTASPH